MGLLDKFNEYLNMSLDTRISDLKKSEEGEPLIKKVTPEGKIERKGLIFDPWTAEQTSGGLFKQRRGYLNNTLLKTVSRRDAIVATILNVRSQQVQGQAHPQADRFDVGFKIKPIDGTADEKEVRMIEDFIMNCGSTYQRSHEDKLGFDQFCYMIARDMLVYGHTAIERVFTADNTKLHHFYPLAAETIYYANDKVDKNYIKSVRDAWRLTIDEEENRRIEAIVNGEYHYVQVVEGRVVEAFTKRELIFSRLFNETDIDLNGYCIGPLEKGLNMITAHLKIENHQQTFFTHGVASKGLLVIQGDVTPNQLRTLQAQWTSQVSGGMNAWRTPILAGIKGVQWVPLTAGNRDMEYAAYQDHVIRNIHAVFNIDPEETGFGYLSKGTEQKALSESNNEWKVTKSLDKGLRPILNRIEHIINEDILPKWNEELSKKYRFCFVGLDAESRLEETSRIQQEVSLHTTIDEAREQIGMEPIKIGGGLILNPLLLQTLQANMPKGLFMERFMGIEGASERPDLQYIPDPLWFQWQQIQMNMVQQAAAGQGEQDGADSNPSDGSGAMEDNAQSDQGNPKQVQEEKAQKDNSNAQAEAQAQRQALAIQQYMAVNPELFKSQNYNLIKSTEPKDVFSHQMADKLEKEYHKASEKLMKEVMDALLEDEDGSK